MADIGLNVEVELSELEEKVRAMDNLTASFPVVCAQMMNAINKEIKKNLQRVARSRGYNKQHNFYKGIFAQAGFKDKQRDYRHLYDIAGIGKPKGVTGRYKYYANTIERGAFINADKPFKVLIDGEWKTLQNFYVPSRPFVRNIINQWYGSKGDSVMDKKASQIIAKYGLN